MRSLKLQETWPAFHLEQNESASGFCLTIGRLSIIIISPFRALGGLAWGSLGQAESEVFSRLQLWPMPTLEA